jgi:hypothetical protein
MSPEPYASLPASAGGLVEIIDPRDRPFLLMGADNALALALPHRWVLGALRDRGGRFWFARRARHDADGRHYWDFSVRGPVAAGEARESAAARLFEEQLAMPGMQPAPRAVLPPLAVEGAKRMTLFVVVHRGAPPLPPSGAGMFLDGDETAGLAGHFPELFSPCLLWCIRRGYLRHSAARSLPDGYGR